MSFITADATAGQGAPAIKGEKSAAATAASDFQAFLKLLTAQLKHQDPLSPLESTQFVQQLATFSAVEQQIETNKLLKDLAAGMNQSGLETATLWIGKDVETEALDVRYAGSPLSFSLPAGASGDIVVRNVSGDIVFRQPVAAGQSEFVWEGKKTDGTDAPFADYLVQIEKTDDNGAITATPVNAVARVMEARLVNGGVYLILDNGAMVNPGAISAVRAPGASV